VVGWYYYQFLWESKDGERNLKTTVKLTVLILHVTAPITFQACKHAPLSSEGRKPWLDEASFVRTFRKVIMFNSFWINNWKSDFKFKKR
jgi:hypothetical protein